MATEMAWNQLANDLGYITPTHTIANITGHKNRQDFLPHPCIILRYFVSVTYFEYVGNAVQTFFRIT
jgi:hypothetical protein